MLDIYLGGKAKNDRGGETRMRPATIMVFASLLTTVCMAVDTGDLMRSLRRELVRVRKEGYYPHLTELLMQRGEELLREGKHEEARELLLRAKGALVDVELPEWARDLCYRQPRDMERMNPERDVIFWRGWVFPNAWPGQWFRGHFRPTRTAAETIDEFHRRGFRVGTYMSGGMVPITFALIPDSEDEWDSFFMRKYAGNYWHHGERWWGVTGDKEGWRKWMIPQLDFAAQVGMDFVHLDEAWGPYPEARQLHERHPFFVVVPNNFGMTYVDSEAFRYGWCAMAEKAGHPRHWDAFNRNLRKVARRAYGVTIWRWLALNESGFYADLAFATTLANRSTDCTLSRPSPQFIRFSRKFADYLYAPFVDVYPPQDAVTLERAHGATQFVLNRRTFVSGHEELILHIFNTGPNARVERPVAVKVDVRRFNLPPSPSVTFVSPDTSPRRISARLNEGILSFEVPPVKVWGIVIIGKPLFPRVHLRMVRRAGEEIRYPLDNHVVPGEPFEVELRAEVLDPLEKDFEVELHLPEGWRVQAKRRTADHTWHYTIVPSPDARVGGGFAITPLVRLQGEVMPSFPLQVIAQPKLSFRILPPCIDAPARGMSDFKLKVSNNSRPCRAHVTLSPPKGWRLSRTDFDFSLAANETRTAEFKMWAPDVGARFWFYKDMYVKVAWRADYTDGRSADGDTSVRVRVFPATFEVYHLGVEKNIMHGYPNAYFRGWNVDAAKRALLDGKFVVLWLVNQDPKEFAPLVNWFLEHGGGVVWMGMPFPGKNCPVELVRGDIRPQWLNIGGARAHPLVAPVARFRSVFGPERGFRGYMVRAKEWSEVIATWATDLSPAKVPIDGTPAIVISRDPRRRIVYVASDLEADNERDYLFEERWHKHNLWHLTYLFYNLLAWASGAAP